jgi:predicted metal-dependent HD superfamily phosphohydrolase
MQGVVPVLHELLSAAGLSRRARTVVLRHMGAPWRRYHGRLHIGLLWFRHRRFARGTPFGSPQASRLIACAIAFHDSVYDPKRRDNEHRSALLWRRCAPSGMSPRDRGWVAAAIEATADHLAPRPAVTQRDRLLLWLLDLDLTPLGEAPLLFARNSWDLRIEYRHLTDAEWRHRRRAFIRTLQAAPRLYRSRPLAIRFEAPARRNLARVLAGRRTKAGSGSALRQ